MIKNIVFDLGEVLIDFDPIQYLKPFGLDDDRTGILSKVIFHSEEWEDCNRGKYENNSDLVEILCDKNPQYADEIRLVLNQNWVKLLVLKEDMAEFLKELKKKNYKIYILSNLSKESYQYIKKYDFWECVDGSVFSYQEKMCKPDLRIYEKLLQKYKLVPEETVFVDDLAKNIEVAKSLKIHGVVFHDFEQTKKEIEEHLKLV